MLCRIFIYNKFELYKNAVVVESAYTHVCRDLSTMIEFLNSFDKHEYGFESIL